MNSQTGSALRPGRWLIYAILIGFALFWPQLTRYSNCLEGANTFTAQQACQQQLSKSVQNEMGVLGG